MSPLPSLSTVLVHLRLRVSLWGHWGKECVRACVRLCVCVGEWGLKVCWMEFGRVRRGPAGGDYKRLLIDLANGASHWLSNPQPALCTYPGMLIFSGMGCVCRSPNCFRKKSVYTQLRLDFISRFMVIVKTYVEKYIVKCLLYQCRGAQGHAEFWCPQLLIQGCCALSAQWCWGYLIIIFCNRRGKFCHPS